jgi:predicted GH43/DUF377 family glycosyl hydrolase
MDEDVFNIDAFIENGTLNLPENTYRKYKKEPIITTVDTLSAKSSLINHFLQIYNTNIVKFKEEPKIQFRYFCFKYINYIKNIPIPADASSFPLLEQAPSV